MLTRSQSHMQSSMATPTKVTRNNKSTCSTATSCKTTTVNNKKHDMDTPLAPVQHRYRTRSTTLNKQEMNSIKKNLNQEFDGVFFDESSIAWNQNKNKLGNGMYAYRTRSTSRK
jgi:hypothetical protein